MIMDGDIDTTNAMMIGVRDEDIMIMMPLDRLTKDQALVAAAYMVLLTNTSLNDFSIVLDQVKNA